MVDGVGSIIENISDQKLMSTFTFNSYSSVTGKIVENLFDRNIGITINKTNSKMTTTTGYILEDIAQRVSEDKKFYNTIANFSTNKLSRRLNINFLDAEGNILYFFKENLPGIFFENVSILSESIPFFIAADLSDVIAKI